MNTEQELVPYRPVAPTLLTLGVFDGVHLGHLSLIRTLNERARALNLQAGVVTFTPHPYEVLHPGEKLPLLAGIEERVRLIREAGVSLIVPLTFTREMSQSGPEQFVRLLTGFLRMSGLLLGPDFALGKDRAGTLQTLKALGKRMSFSVEAVAPFLLGGEVVSSTAIRTALAQGDLDRATRFLGRRFSVTGAVTSTSRRGASLGFPTANLAVDPGRALPGDGVYVTIAHVHGERHASVTNIGHRPTFRETERVVETHILDFHGCLYGDSLTVEFAARLRDETPFPDREHLVAQIEQDVAAARRILGANE
ncbi:MAG: bifunctional riboflavin kinase/FAD synthetase [Dehalococcoidia bacterium]|jgi:riboflavin kinase/FMN adenylyltransferase|nr:bifunctional riboflavin kinase/FAD synthetase [Dehalococcoidia bacterium]